MIKMTRQKHIFINLKNIDRMKKIFFLLLISLVTKNTLAQTKLSDMTEAQRNTELINIAKATFKIEMPDVYREYGTPTIEKGVINYTPTSYDESWYGEAYGDIYYIVTFPRNPETETELFIDGFAAKIHIWDDTKEAFIIEYGNSEGIRKLICKRDKR